MNAEMVNWQLVNAWKYTYEFHNWGPKEELGQIVRSAVLIRDLV